MSASEPKKRPWFQFHLSTAVVLMFVASGLLGMNMLNWNREYQLADGTAKYACGWLVTCIEEYPLDAGELRFVFVGNLCLSLMIFAVAAVLCEWLIRRKERKT